MEIEIDGETYTIENTRNLGFGELIEIETEEGEDFILAPTSHVAGEAAREYWADLVESDPDEFECLVGSKCLIAWALGRYAGPGSRQVPSLSAWLDLWLDTPEEQWAGYDSTERDAEATIDGVEYTVAYRSN